MLKNISSKLGPRRLVCGLIAGIVAGCLAYPLEPMTRGLVGWCCGIAVYLFLAWRLAVTFGPEQCRKRAQSLDDPNVLILVVMLCIAAVSLGVIVMLLKNVKGLSDAERAGHVVLALVSLAGSWLMIHTVYAFHYAHRYYNQEKDNKVSHGGLDFPGKLDPDYFDFLYFSYVVGMTSQVSDVQVTSSTMRRLTLVHSVLSFAFNMLVVALSINVVASAL